jgi:hypothetical protein
MPGKIFSNLVSFDFLIKADFISHLKWWLFFWVLLGKSLAAWGTRRHLKPFWFVSFSLGAL